MTATWPYTLTAIYRGRAWFAALVHRTWDVLASTVLLLCLAPLLLLVAALIRFDTPGPALFRQERIGRYRQPFVMYKFRTMDATSDDRLHQDYVTKLMADQAPVNGGEPGVYKLTDDPRITRIGRFLRRSSIDELPQLLNVARGEMTLVGPRPAIAYEVNMYKPHHLRRFDVKPGLTGLWQVSGRSIIPLQEALDLDVAYVRDRSPRLDLKILARTVLVVLRGLGAR